ncbi:MAG: efflux RND transporter periplasmic adaptor subunit [Chitinophagales bacterium]|nr:efflux RND transporter periplasmic adaptor subunit [Chitinophagales bacterium]
MKNQLLITLLLAALAGCSSSDADQKKTESGAAPEKAVLVTVTEAAPSPFQHYIELQGKVEAEDNVTVTPQVPGTIKSISVSIGQQVRKGQVLAETDNGAMQQNVEGVKNQLAFANDLYAKQKALWEQNIGTEVQYLTSKNTVQTLEKQLAATNEQFAMSRLVSPINGVVDAVDLKVGQMGSPGFGGIRVVNMSNLKAVGDVSESYAASVVAGKKVMILFPTLNTEIESQVSYAAKVINPQSRSFKVEAKLPSKEAYKPNMIVVIKILDYEAKSTFVLDVNLIHKSGDGQFIYVATDDGARKTAKREVVTTGIIYDGKIEVISGITAGDKIITAGYQDLISGQVIKF